MRDVSIVTLHGDASTRRSRPNGPKSKLKLSHFILKLLWLLLLSYLLFFFVFVSLSFFSFFFIQVRRNFQFLPSVFRLFCCSDLLMQCQPFIHSRLRPSWPSAICQTFLRPTLGFSSTSSSARSFPTLANCQV